MRAIAEEAGYAIGTLYDYFPDRMALFSGYVRFVLERHAKLIEAASSAGSHATPVGRLRALLGATWGDDPATPYFDCAMMAAEGRIAERWHHRRGYETLASLWERTYAACAPHAPAGTGRHLFAIVWGTRRYLLLVDEPDADRTVFTRILQMCLLGQGGCATLDTRS